MSVPSTTNSCEAATTSASCDAHANGRVVVTHDSDFGKLAIQASEPYTGILFLRPGHISPQFVLGSLAALEASSIDVTPPFIAVVERKDDQVRVRVRSG
jgi:predicted nuclease of predicted toxin-antitoxin system